MPESLVASIGPRQCQHFLRRRRRASGGVLLCVLALAFAWTSQRYNRAPVTQLVENLTFSGASVPPPPSLGSDTEISVVPQLEEEVNAAYDLRWWFESCVGVGSLRAGLPAIAVQVLWMAPMEVMGRIVKDKSVGNLPLMSYSAMMTNGFIWTVYGLLLGSSGVWVPNALGCIFGSAYTAIFLRHCPAEADWLPSTRSVHIAMSCGLAGITVVAALALEQSMAISFIGIMGNIIAVMMLTGPLAAVKTVINEQSTHSLPFGFAIVTVVNCSLWIIFGFMILGDPMVGIPNVLGLASGLVQLSLFAYYGFPVEVSRH